MQPRGSTPSRPPRAPGAQHWCLQVPTQPSYPPPDSLLVEVELTCKYMMEMVHQHTELEENEQQEQQDKTQDATEDEDSVDDATEGSTRSGVRKKSFKRVSQELDRRIEEALAELRQPSKRSCPTV